jgi:hypothetical protein
MSRLGIASSSIYFLSFILCCVAPQQTLAAMITGTFEIGTPTVTGVTDKLQVVLFLDPTDPKTGFRINLNLGINAKDNQASKADKLAKLLNTIMIKGAPTNPVFRACLESPKF